MLHFRSSFPKLILQQEETSRGKDFESQFFVFVVVVVVATNFANDVIRSLIVRSSAALKLQLSQQQTMLFCFTILLKLFSFLVTYFVRSWHSLFFSLRVSQICLDLVLFSPTSIFFWVRYYLFRSFSASPLNVFFSVTRWLDYSYNICPNLRQIWSHWLFYDLLLSYLSFSSTILSFSFLHPIVYWLSYLWTTFNNQVI